MNDEQLRALQREAQRLETRQGGDRVERVSPPAARSTESFAATLTLFTGIQAGPFTMLVGMGTFCAAIGAGLWRDHPGSVQFTLIAGLLGLMGLAGWTFLLIAVVKWLGFRGWRSKLPFPLTGDGWEQLASTRDDHRWFDTRLEVVLETSASENVRTGTAAMLRIFCTQANASQYTLKRGALAAWKAGGLVASGDAGARVAWKLYRFIAKALPPLGAVKEVRLTVTRSFTASPEDNEP
ncbi:MAG: hypothetical protein JNK82_45230 [Myxococcaceae bacterium]|nr:hypothetical protein [Myxococcaceae bacterium]